ncbi:MAG: RNA methyltransferase PUA domain-containing protein [Sphaerochaeta sp.]
MNIILFDDLYAENSLPADDYRALHIKKVLRLKAGDRFTAGVINAQKGEATLLSMTAEEIVFSFQANGDATAGAVPGHPARRPGAPHLDAAHPA